MLFGLFAFILLPTLEVDASLQLKSPPDGVHENFPIVFRWTRSANSAVRSYRLKIAMDQNMENVVLDLPKAGNSIIAPQIAVISGLVSHPDYPTYYYWRVIALDELGNPVEQSQEILSFDLGGTAGAKKYTIISGMIKSDLNQLGLAGARVAVSGEGSGGPDYIAESVFNGEYIIIAETSFIPDGSNVPNFPIKITSTKVGYQPTTIILQESERHEPDSSIFTITCDIMMIFDTDPRRPDRVLQAILTLLLGD